ncbi:MAG: ribonuclease Y [Gemmatimonadales bacterium]|nr:ribonuclease Y [Gemmatimonadales bacterium]
MLIDSPFFYPVVAAGVFFLLGWFVFKLRYEARHGRLQQASQELLGRAEQAAKDIRKEAELEAKEEFYEARRLFEKETEKTRTENRRRQETLDMRESNLIKKVAFIDQKETRLDTQDEELRSRQKDLTVKNEDLDGLIEQQGLKLQQVAGMTADNAKAQLMQDMVEEARLSAARSIKQVRDEADRTARREAMKILSLAVQRYASEHVAESTVSVVDLPSDDMKGRIIGREGRNIRAFEMATGIDVIIDDTPGAVIVSGFDPVRREIARQSLEILVRDGRIHPGRIEEVVKKTHQEIMDKILEIGEQECLDVGLQNVNPEFYHYVGRLNYRTSYGQNLLKHSREVAAVAAVIASELGLDPRLARRCGFFHDIGKAVDHEVEGPHAVIGARLCKKFGENDIVINAVGGHHEDVEAKSPYTFITVAADAVSASRPGARRESLETYVQRLENLEEIAHSFKGVEKSYAIQAGREIRVLVNHSKVSDAEAAVLAEEVSRRIEGELEYPGQIKVMVIRETRATSYAR